jgi:hypothetical protein
MKELPENTSFRMISATDFVPEALFFSAIGQTDSLKKTSDVINGCFLSENSMHLPRSPKVA